MKDWLLRLLRAAGPNTVPLAGWFVADWSAGTTLAVYWAENLAGALLLTLLLVRHRQASRARGYRGGFIGTFLSTAVAFSVAHGIFLALIIGSGLVGAVPDRAALVTALQWMLSIQVGTFLIDAWLVPGWRFGALRARTSQMLGRVILVHLSIIGGAFVAAGRGAPHAFFTVFIVLKTVVDLGSMMPAYKPGKKPPRWMAWAMNGIPGKGGSKSFEAHWQEGLLADAEQAARDEEIDKRKRE